MLSAMGVGVLYGKYDLLKSMNPFLLRGRYDRYVYEDYSTYLTPAEDLKQELKMSERLQVYLLPLII